MVRTLRSPKLQKKYRFLLAAKTILIIIAIVAIVGLPALLSRANFLKIQSISVSGNSVLDSSEINKNIESEIQGNYFYIFSKSNIFLFPKNKVEKIIMANFSRAESVYIKRGSLTSIAVAIEERKPKDLWCDAGEPPVCYFLDTEGYIFDTAPEFSSDVYTVYTGQVTGNPIGSRYGSKEDFASIQLLLKGMSDLGLSVNAVNFIHDKSYEALLKSGGSILFSLEGDPAKVISNLESLLNDSALSLLQDGVLTVNTLDLRYGNKIIIKKK